MFFRLEKMEKQSIVMGIKYYIIPYKNIFNLTKRRRKWLKSSKKGSIIPPPAGI